MRLLYGFFVRLLRAASSCGFYIASSFLVLMLRTRDSGLIFFAASTLRFSSSRAVRFVVVHLLARRTFIGHSPHFGLSTSVLRLRCSLVCCRCDHIGALGCTSVISVVYLAQDSGLRLPRHIATSFLVLNAPISFLFGFYIASSFLVHLVFLKRRTRGVIM